jgi:hypothetical protein
MYINNLQQILIKFNVNGETEKSYLRIFFIELFFLVE